jgi:hypothetical protein
MFHSQCYLVATVIYIQSLRSQICVYVCVCVCVYIYIYIYVKCLQYRAASRVKKYIKIGTKVNAVRQGNPSACRRFASPALVRLHGEILPIQEAFQVTGQPDAPLSLRHGL